MEGKLSESLPAEAERLDRSRPLFDPDEPIHISLETTNRIREIYGLEPYNSDSAAEEDDQV